ncbi:TPA: terminase small subunit [Enterobacter roggenkampii]|uniref:Terminase small subunit n=1 Tax=Salmonella enterica subsp. enterica serovar Guildford TaxID=2564497 RepID=A0A636P773_SALET|nr:MULTISPECIES: terminase small subunit [Enterobacter cloacae complex]EAP2255452.1 terminase small subunit [Salmonella enterica]EBV1210094.1 terminase small subunit [Salmonella enterica subsp. enterica serovar Guildford]EDQ7217506.1 terminase small subunit [Salmonella enterica subsp. enterica]EAZ5606647.1 terminase small subunit [Salmonella enterica]EDI1036925.1 terminase small subunit [Salmonella enterica subsp. enterica serovar Guildford]
MAKLTDKQELFAREYLKDLNATQAAIRAGYSEKTAKEVGYENLTKPHVLELVAELKAQRVEQTGIDAAYVLRRLTEIDQMDVLDILLANGELKPIKDWPKVWRTTLSGMDVVEMASADSAALLKKIKWPDKVKNLELLGKHVNVQAFREQTATEITGANGGPVRYADMSEELLEEKLKELGNGRRSNQLESKRSDL